MDEKDLDEPQVIAALKEQIRRTYSPGFVEAPLANPSDLAEKHRIGEQPLQEKLIPSLAEAENIISGSWFKDVYLKDKDLRKFYEDYKGLKGQ